MTNKLLVSIACIISIFTTDVYAEQISFVAHKYTVTDGLPSNNIRELVQDGDGYIWLGTTGGLCRFDGYQFHTFNTFNNPSQGSNTLHVGEVEYSSKTNSIWIRTSSLLNACYELRNGQFVDYTGVGRQYDLYNKRDEFPSAIWLYGQSNGARRIVFKDGKYTSTDYTKGRGLPSEKVIKPMESSKGYTWLITKAGYSIVDPQGKVCFTDRKTVCKDIERCGDYILLIDDDTVLEFNATGRFIKRFQLPSPMGTMGNVTATLVSGGKLFIFTSEKVFLFDVKTGSFSISSNCNVKDGHFQETTKHYTLISNRGTDLVIIDDKANVQKLKIMDELHMSYDKTHIYSAVEARNGLLYIATYGNGLFIYNPRTHEVCGHYTTQSDGYFNNDYLQDIIIDKEGNIWVSSETAGLSCLSRTGSAESSYLMLTQGGIGEWSNNIRNVNWAGNNDNIWLSTKDNKIYNYNVSSGTVSLVKVVEAPVFTTCRDSKGHMWVGFRGTGITVDNKPYTQDSGIGLQSNDIYKILEDKLGRMWLATWQGGLCISDNTAGQPLHFANYLTSSYNEKRQHDLCLGDNGDMWIATNNGLYVVDSRKKKITAKDFTNYNTQNGSLPTNEIVCLYFDHATHTLWAGTTGCGVIRMQIDANHKVTHCRVIDSTAGLANNIVKAIIKDKNNQIWVSTEEDLSRIDTKNGGVRTFHIGQQIQSNIFSENAALLASDGRIIFGTGYGLAVVRPKVDKAIGRENVNICITDLLINGISVYNTPDMQDAQRAFASENSISLTHNQNSITLFFSNFIFSQTGSSLYQYKMNGVDKDWCSTTSENFAEYSNLAPGDYTFTVRTLVDGKWIESKPFSITIQQPLYNTWWAWLLYILIIGTIGWYLYRQLRKNMKLQQEISFSEKATEFRLAFFTNVTHEFRTPLAIISNAMDALSHPNTQMAQKAAIKSAKRGTNRMLRLVNELMEFRKLSVGGSRLAVQKDDIIAYIRNIYQDHWNISKHKEIDMTFMPFAKEYEMAFDHTKVETIIFNIISNAVKYTPQHGHITIRVSLDQQKDNIVISVEDSGKGITEEQEKELFQPFMHGLVSQGGMGIGLYSAREMARLHHGDITYCKSESLGGAQFTITLPASEDIYTAEEYAQELAVDSDSTDDTSIVEEVIHNMHAEALNDINIAIIEDDMDMLEQISSAMSQYFHVTTYTNGADAVTGILSTKPDVIISDVMLPDTNGYEIVKKIRKETDFLHTPIIMLTALDDERHQMRGYEAGADDYVTKPCNFRVLLARIVQLITWAQKREQQTLAMAAENNAAENNAAEPAEHPSTTQHPITQQPITLSPLDRKFRETLDYLVAQHIGDTDFNIDRLASMMQMGHTKFYGRMKEVVGISPNKYLMNERMRIAGEMILEGKYSVSEVGMKVGFQDQSYFNKCFKQYFGTSPSKYGK